jgi:carboxyl-terminal processing protease
VAGALKRLGLVALVAAAFAAGRLSTAGAAQAATPYAALDTLARVLTQVQLSYVEETDQPTLVYAALRGLTGALDRHSAFLDPATWRRIQEESEGQYVGIGTETRTEACGLRVLDVLRDGPAERGGVLPGDCIVAADGAPLAAMSPEEADARVRGREGDAVTLLVDRGAEQRTLVLLRSRVLEPAVEGEVVSPGIVLLRIRQFRERTAVDLAAEVTRLGPVRGAVLDLRDNPGGRLDEAVAVVDHFVRSGLVVRTQGRGPGSVETHSATDDASDWDWPVVVLVDGRTASAAEIVAGALRDLGRATLVGARTYGKGSVQTVFAYDDGAALKLTIGRYYLPKGEPILDGEGLVPDVPVATAPDPAAALRALVDDSPGLRPADRQALGREVERLAGPGPLPPPRSGPMAARLAADPALAAALARLR